MKMKNNLKVVFTSMMIVSGLAACDSEGPAEKAGKKIDQVTENVSDSVSNAAERADQAVTNLTNTTEQVVNDTAITTKVKSALLNELGTESMKLTVSTEKGVVTLSGPTDDHEKIEKVIKLAASVEGVRAVRDELFVSK
jgi:hyperosmotically inducible periplasmic protein